MLPADPSCPPFGGFLTTSPLVQSGGIPMGTGSRRADGSDGHIRPARSECWCRIQEGKSNTVDVRAQRSRPESRGAALEASDASPEN